MSDACTVIIGAETHLDALRERARASGEVLAFTDAEVPGALEAITKRLPRIITLERLFAATSRGAALINRIKADPSLASVEIRVISHDGEYSRVSPRRARPAAAAANAAAPATDARIDWRGTRRAPRFRMRDDTDAQVDGGAATLIDVSAMGAQIISKAALKPQQRLRIVLADDLGIVRFSAAVAWASFEIPKGVTRYRAGIEFQDAEAEAVEAFAKRHESSS